MSTVVLPNVSVIALRRRAIVIEGAAGSGKTSLALGLIDRGAMLVGDDGVTLESRDDALWASPPPNIEGLLEIRNVGIVSLPTTSAPIALVLSIDNQAPRFIDEAERRDFHGHAIPRLLFHTGDANQAIRAEFALEKHGLPFPNMGESTEKGAS